MAAGASPNRVRKSLIVTSHVLTAASMLACAVGDAQVSLIALFVAGVAFGLNSANIFAIAQTLAGPRAAGAWVGFQNCIGNIAGIVAPIVTGVLVDRTGHFTAAFGVAAAVALTGVLGWGVLIPRVAPLAWPTAATRRLGQPAGVTPGPI